MGTEEKPCASTDSSLERPSKVDLLLTEGSVYENIYCKQNKRVEIYTECGYNKCEVNTFYGT